MHVYMYTSRVIETVELANVTEHSAGERAYRTIRGLIVSLEFKPNQAIGEKYLAELLGMSRTPIREALTRLSGEELVEFRSRAGTIVSPIRIEAVQSAQFVREKLELAIIEEATLQSTAQFRFKIRQAIDEQTFAIDEGNAALFFASDERMHQTFCDMVSRNSIWSVISDAKKHLDRVRRLSLQETDLSLLLNDHARLLAAIESGDSVKAQQVMKTHLRRVMEDLDRLVELYHDYFETLPSYEREVNL